MISKIILHNFQSHAHTEVSFSEGITSIVGESDNGKTAIMRAFQWIWRNRPTGNDFVSHWATDEDLRGNVVITDTCYVTVIFNDGNYVTREKNEHGFNGYKFGTYKNGKFTEDKDKEKSKVGINVPFDVSDMFNMEDVNIQNQHDSMFLLSESGQDVARFFNKLIKLDVSDTALSLVESRKRNALKETRDIQTEIDELTESLNKLNWVDEAVILADRIEITENKIESGSDELFNIDQMIDNITVAENNCELPKYHEKAEMSILKIDMINTKLITLDDKIYSLSVLENDLKELHLKIRNSQWTSDSSIIVTSIENIQKTIDAAEQKFLQVEKILTEIEKCEKGLTEVSYAEKAEQLINKIDNSQNTIISISEKIDDVELAINKIQNCNKKIKEKTESIILLSKQLPDTCPLCGSKIKDGLCVS